MRRHAFWRMHFFFCALAIAAFPAGAHAEEPRPARGEEELSEFTSVLQVTLKVDRTRDRRQPLERPLPWQGPPLQGAPEAPPPPRRAAASPLRPPAPPQPAAPPGKLAPPRPLQAPAEAVRQPPARVVAQVGPRGFAPESARGPWGPEAGEEPPPGAVAASRARGAPSSPGLHLLQMMMSSSVRISAVSVIVIGIVALGVVCTCGALSFYMRRDSFAGSKPAGASSRRGSFTPSRDGGPPQSAKPPSLSGMQSPFDSRTPTPSPRKLAQMQASQAALDRRLLLCEPGTWSDLLPFFLIKAEQLYNIADSQGSENLLILEGGTERPALLASIRPFGALPRVLTMSRAAAPDQPIASCAPCMMMSMDEEICHKLEIRGKDNRMWGTVLPTSADTYGVFQSRPEPVLVLDGDQENGRLIARVAREVVAHATRGRDGEHLEVGVRPHLDPVLMLMLVLAVVIFNPEEPELAGDGPCGR